jgi:Sulfotransferase family
MAGKPRIKALFRLSAGGRESIRLPDLSLGEALQRARALSSAKHAKDLRALISRKTEGLRCYDVLNMERLVAISHWGRSGSFLVASYLDGHENVVLLPPTGTERIYEFFERYPSLSLHDKLAVYPILSTDFFKGEFPIVAADYYAAVAAIAEVYGGCSQLLETRRAFLQFLHVAYSLALGRRPVSPQPLMVYSLHWWDDALARRLLQDFPQAQFLHTVRDPITTYDRSFEHFLKCNEDEETSWWMIRYLNKADHPYAGMESRTWTIRFEDLHNKTEEITSRLADWLGLPYQVSLSKSTFNGAPYVVERGGITWSGARPEQAQRFLRNVSVTDQAILFALFYENFVAWDYYCPKIFRHALVRGLTCMLLLPVPWKAEIISARATITLRVLPSLRRGDFWFAFKGLFRVFRRRLAIMWEIASEICRRLVGGKAVLEIR